MSLNKVQLIGFVGTDPEVQIIGLGVKNAKFRLATNNFSRKDDKETESIAVWHNIECWRNTAEYIQNSVKKGDKIYIEGKLHYRTDNSCTPKRTFTSIIASEIIMLHRKADNYTNREEAQ